MKAVAKLAPKPGALELVDLPVPKRRKGEVLLRTLAAGICGTDVSLWHWREAIAATYAPDFPLILGHEFAGEVVECDANARVSVGDIVAVNPQVGCGQCITGSRGYNDTTWYRMLPMVKKFAPDIQKLVTQELKLEQFETALNMVEERREAKILLRP